MFITVQLLRSIAVPSKIGAFSALLLLDT